MGNAGSAVDNTRSAVGSAGSAIATQAAKIPAQAAKIPGIQKGEPKYKSYLETVGKTVSTHLPQRSDVGACAHRTDRCHLDSAQPLVKLDRMLPDEAKHATVLVKLEMQNPGGSIKDRIALNMIEEAEKAGTLKPGMTVVEGTSGNTGIGVAMVCAAKGYKCIIIMPQVPAMQERVMIIRQFGGDVHLTAAGLGSAPAASTRTHAGLCGVVEL